MPTTERPSLPELQRWMRWALTHPGGAGAVIGRPHGKVATPKAWTRGPEPLRALPAIGETSEVSKETRLSIYGDGYFLRLVGVLGQNYEALRNVVGAHEFDHHLGRDYLVAHPSTFKCIDNVGARMAAFLKRRPETKRFPFLPDLARLEWAFHESFFADERPPLDRASIEGRSLDAWAGARIWLDPSVRLLELAHPVVDLWRADGNWSPRKLAGLKAAPQRLLVFRRPDGQVRAAEQIPAAFALLKRLDDAVPFGPALKASLRGRGAEPDTLMRLFREWVELGVIRSVDFR